MADKEGQSSGVNFGKGAEVNQAPGGRTVQDDLIDGVPSDGKMKTQSESATQKKEWDHPDRVAERQRLVNERAERESKTPIQEFSLSDIEDRFQRGKSTDKFQRITQLKEFTEGGKTYKFSETRSRFSFADFASGDTSGRPAIYELVSGSQPEAKAKAGSGTDIKTEGDYVAEAGATFTDQNIDVGGDFIGRKKIVK